MELTEVMLTFAQAAMVIAGFGGVVITLQDRTNQWGKWERIEFRSILEVSGVVIFFSVLPIVLQSLLEAELSWKISILLFAIVHGALIIIYRVGVASEDIPAVFKRVHISAGLLILSQLICGVLGNQDLIEIAYSLGLLWLVGVGGWLFYLLALGTEDSSVDE